MKITSIAAALAVAGLAASGAAAQVALSAETADPLGVPGQMVRGLSALARQAGVADLQVTGVPTLAASVLNLAEGKTDITAAPFVLPFLLSRGAGPYEGLGKTAGAQHARQLAVLYTARLGVFALSAYQTSGVTGWDSLAGRVIYTGAPGSAAQIHGRGVMRIATGLSFGEEYTGLQAAWQQAVPRLRDGQAEAFLLPSDFPDARHADAAAAGAMTMWSMPKAAFESQAAQRYAKAPGSALIEMPLAQAVQAEGVTVVSEDGMFRGLALLGGVLVRKGMDEEQAYRLTKAMLDNLDAPQAGASARPWAALGEVDQIKTTGMCGAVPLKYHPGAVRAWEEAGFAVPDCARP